uniref:type IV pilus assembly protein FimV n=1 Tax=Delftia acidovorans TaxID=80866 RepID=UPI0035A11A1E
AQMRPGVTYELHEDVDPGDFGPATIPVPVSVHAELETEPAPQAPAPVRTSGPEAIKARRMVQPGELFDVQQQAEFFISVGEHQQAIELLRSHIDTHEDSSPLAYLELLHLYYTLSRRDDFDQLRARFARHFNARVPAMPGFTDKGSSLLQGYPEQLARIEALWPVDEVEACLAHYLFKQDGAPDPDAPAPFDLAAFDDLLLLLSIARTSPAGTRGEPGPRERTTPRMVAGTAVAGAATAGAAAFTAAAEATPAQAPASAATGVDWMAELQPPIEPAQPQPASVTPLEPGLEFTPMDTLPLSTGAVGGGDRPASGAPDSLSAPLHFELQPLNFDLDQAGQLPAGQVRAVPLGEAPSFIHDESAPLLDIDLTDLGENELPHVDVPSRFPPVTLSMPGSGAVGFSSHNLKAPLDMDLALDKWELEPPDTVREHRGLDEPLSRSVDMLLSRETDPAFRRSPQPASPQADDKDPPKG